MLIPFLNCKIKYYLNKEDYDMYSDYYYNIRLIKDVFNNLIENSPLIKEVVKYEIIKNIGLTEELNNIDLDLLKITEKKILIKLKETKFNLFMERNKDILLMDIYNYLLKFDVYDGDISCELIII